MTTIPANAHVTDIPCPACGQSLHEYEAMIGSPRTAVLDCYTPDCCMRSGRLTISRSQFAAMTMDEVAALVERAKASWR